MNEKFIEDVIEKSQWRYRNTIIHKDMKKVASKYVIISKKTLDDLIEKYEIEDMWEQSIEAWIVLEDIKSLKENS